MSRPRVALVCDWLTTIGGAESVLLALHEMYPEAPIYTSKYDESRIDWFKDAKVCTGFLQYFPNCLRRFIGPLRQFYFSHLDLSDYDLVISVTGAEAKAVRTDNKYRQKKKTRTNDSTTEQPEHHCTHLCYCHVPTQYYWGMYDEYLKNPGFGLLNPIARIGLKCFVAPLRKSDFKSAQRPDEFITISTYAANLIQKYYQRSATIIYPPANLEKFKKVKFSTNDKKFSTIAQNKVSKNQGNKQKNYVTTSRQVNWKCLDICVKACKKTGDNLLLIGDGPEHNNLVKLANGAPNIHFLPTLPQEELNKYLRQSDAFLFPSLEPFGLAPIEAMATGIPVLAFSQGGAKDYIINGKNGLFFDRQTPSSLIKAMNKFSQMKFDSQLIAQSVQQFDKKIFKQKMQEYINEKLR